MCRIGDGVKKSWQARLKGAARSCAQVIVCTLFVTARRFRHFVPWSAQAFDLDSDSHGTHSRMHA